MPPQFLFLPRANFFLQVFRSAHTVQTARQILQVAAERFRMAQQPVIGLILLAETETAEACGVRKALACAAPSSQAQVIFLLRQFPQILRCITPARRVFAVIQAHRKRTERDRKSQRSLQSPRGMLRCRNVLAAFCGAERRQRPPIRPHRVGALFHWKDLAHRSNVANVGERNGLRQSAKFVRGVQHVREEEIRVPERAPQRLAVAPVPVLVHEVGKESVAPRGKFQDGIERDHQVVRIERNLLGQGNPSRVLPQNFRLARMLQHRVVGELGIYLLRHDVPVRFKQCGHLPVQSPARPEPEQGLGSAFFPAQACPRSYRIQKLLDDRDLHPFPPPAVTAAYRRCDGFTATTIWS
jgi:hypothetical protein